MGRPSECGPVQSTRVFVLRRTPKALDTEEEAAAWLVRLDANSSAATLASWQQWLREDTGHHDAFVRVEKGWRRSECLKSLRPLDGAVKLDYRPVKMRTLTNEVSVFPPKKRVY